MSSFEWNFNYDNSTSCLPYESHSNKLYFNPKTCNPSLRYQNISDLEKMAVESTSLPALDAIKIFSKYSTDDVNSNDLFSLEIKNNSAGNAELDRAKDILLKVCSEKGCLKLENLFELTQENVCLD